VLSRLFAQTFITIHYHSRTMHSFKRLLKLTLISIGQLPGKLTLSRTWLISR